MPRHTRHEQTKRRLLAKGWTQLEAAEAVGVRIEHVNRVLNGHRKSQRLLDRLEALPAKEVAPVQ